jgi:hypothetical protein
MCALADEFGTFRASLLQFMLRSMLILSRSCCIDLRTARCLRAYWTMFNDRFAATSGHSVAVILRTDEPRQDGVRQSSRYPIFASQ